MISQIFAPCNEPRKPLQDQKRETTPAEAALALGRVPEGDEIVVKLVEARAAPRHVGRKMDDRGSREIDARGAHAEDAPTRRKFGDCSAANYVEDRLIGERRRTVSAQEVEAFLGYPLLAHRLQVHEHHARANRNRAEGEAARGEPGRLDIRAEVEAGDVTTSDDQLRGIELGEDLAHIA